MLHLGHARGAARLLPRPTGCGWCRPGSRRSATARSAGDPDRRLAWLLVAATVPAAVAGFLLERPDRDRLPRGRAGRGRRSWSAAAILWLAERRGPPEPRRSTTLTFRGALGIGAAQALALVPGHLRSGISISAGPVRRPRPGGCRPLLVPDGHPDHRRRRALYEARKLVGRREPASTCSSGPLAGRAWSPRSSPASLAIAVLLRFLRTRSHDVFVVYRRRPGRGRRRRLAGARAVGERPAPMEVMKQLRQRAIRDLVDQRPHPDAAGARGRAPRAGLPDDAGDDLAATSRSSG